MIDDLLQERETLKTFPVYARVPAVGAIIDEKNKGPAQFPSPSLGVVNEYELKLSVGVTFTANTAEYERRREQAVKQLKHSLYGDMLKDLHEALNLSTDSQMSKILHRMMDKITG